MVDRLTDKTLRLALRTAARVIHQIDRREEPEPTDSLELESHLNPKPGYETWRPINANLETRGQTAPIEGAPAVELERPLVMVPGYRSKADCFDSLANTLVQDGKNGGRWYLLEDGAAFDAAEPDQAVLMIPGDAKVFVTRFEGNVEAPDQAAQALSTYIDQVTEATDHEKVDLQGYSMGGLTCRSHLDQEDDPKVAKLMQVGTPNHGSGLARLATVYLEERPQDFGEVGVLEKKMVAGNDHAAASWLQPAGRANPQLEGLNSRWELQRGKLEDFKVVGSDSRRTVGPNFIPQSGDGIVHAKSLALPGEQPVMVDPEIDLGHSDLVRSREVFEEAQEFFGWQIADPTVGGNPSPAPAPERPSDSEEQLRFF